MARIIYGVQGEGRGHGSRSRTVIEHLLERGHEVRVFTSHKGLDYLKQFFPEVTKILGLVFEFQGEKLDLVRTVRRNLEEGSVQLPATFRTLTAAWKELTSIAITDFEPFVPYARGLLNIPFVSIDHQHVLSQYRLDYPHAWRGDYLTGRTLVDNIYWGAGHYFVSSFFFPEVRPRYRNRSTLVGPLLRREVVKQRPRHDGPVLLYATTTEARRALELFRGRRSPVSPTASAGGRDRRTTSPTGGPPPAGSWKTSPPAQAVVTNGGYTLMSESLYLGKPVYSLPSATSSSRW